MQNARRHFKIKGLHRSDKENLLGALDIYLRTPARHPDLPAMYLALVLTISMVTGIGVEELPLDKIRTFRDNLWDTGVIEDN